MDTPTEPGYYWFQERTNKPNPHDEWVMLLYDSEHDEFFQMDSREAIHSSNIDGVFIRVNEPTAVETINAHSPNAFPNT